MSPRLQRLESLLRTVQSRRSEPGVRFAALALDPASSEPVSAPGEDAPAAPLVPLLTEPAPAFSPQSLPAAGEVATDRDAADAAVSDAGTTEALADAGSTEASDTFALEGPTTSPTSDAALEVDAGPAPDSLTKASSEADGFAAVVLPENDDSDAADSEAADARASDADAAPLTLDEPEFEGLELGGPTIAPAAPASPDSAELEVDASPLVPETIAAAPVASGDVGAVRVAAVQGQVPGQAPKTFRDLLDRSLALRPR